MLNIIIIIVIIIIIIIIVVIIIIKPMVETTTKKVNQFMIKSLLQGHHIDEMTGKWPSLTPNPP